MTTTQNARPGCTTVGRRRAFSRRVLVGVLLLVGVAGMAAAGQTLAARPATGAEIESLLAAVHQRDGDPSSELAAAGARISTVDPRWAVADVGGTSSGYQLQSARYVFRRADPTLLDWRVVTLGSSIGGCRRLLALGMPARVIDDLRASTDITYSCLRPPPTAVPCLVTSRPEWFSVARRTPRRCELSLSGDDDPPSARLARLRALRWVRTSRTEAIAIGAALPNHAPFNAFRIRVRFLRPVEVSCGPQFSRAVVVSAFGRQAGPLSVGRCPRA